MVKRILGWFFKTAVFNLGLLEDLNIILMYHRVVDQLPNGLHDSGMFVTSNTLKMHINEISRFFKIVPLESLLKKTKHRGRQCAFTFDDGWIDNYDVAFPILKANKIPATIFLPVNHIGRHKAFWFQHLWSIADIMQEKGSKAEFIDHFKSVTPSWRLMGTGYKEVSNLAEKMKQIPADEIDAIVEQAYDKFGVPFNGQRDIIDWNDVLKMGEKGITFGSHGLNHYILPTLNHTKKKRELFDSLEILQSKAVQVSPFLSYPNGNWDDESLNLVSKAGYLGAVTTRLGCNTPQTHAYLLNRISLHEYISHTPALFWFRIFQAVFAGSGYKRN
ncbi:MAG: polysaccharide deacetylase family protein [Desulfobacteraceae bacterium]|nr:polysaccharide deacetylase family protein [Desulfobacteraceae bacterium]